MLSLVGAFPGVPQDPQAGGGDRSKGRAGALTRESEMPSLSASWRGTARDRMDGCPGPAAGQGVGVSVEKPNPGVFTVDKRKGLERGSGSSHQLLWLEASGKVLGHLGQVLFRDRKDPKRVAICTPTGWGLGSTH